MREVLDQIFGQRRIVGQIACQQIVVERHLGIGEHDRKFGPRQALARRDARGQDLVVGQIFDRAVEAP